MRLVSIGVKLRVVESSGHSNGHAANVNVAVYVSMPASLITGVGPGHTSGEQQRSVALVEAKRQLRRPPLPASVIDGAWSVPYSLLFTTVTAQVRFEEPRPGKSMH